MRKLPLSLDLVPHTSFNMNLRSVFPPEDWDVIRRLVYKRAGHCCETCGVTGKMSAHEVWDYQETEQGNFVVLKGMVCLCEDCHMCKHWGFATLLSKQGKLSIEKLEKHFMTVNKCRRKTMELHQEQEFAEWDRRSKLTWQLNIDYLDTFLDEELEKKMR